MRELKQATVVSGELALSFVDGSELFLNLERLRKACPCAACTGAHGTARLQKSDTGPAELSQIQLVGSYALQLTWQDGCGAGIYSFDYLAGLEG